MIRVRRRFVHGLATLRASALVHSPATPALGRRQCACPLAEGLVGLCGHHEAVSAVQLAGKITGGEYGKNARNLALLDPLVGTARELLDLSEELLNLDELMADADADDDTMADLVEEEKGVLAAQVIDAKHALAEHFAELDRHYGDDEQFVQLCTGMRVQLEADEDVNPPCNHRWVFLRDRVHNKGDGKGKYMAFKCSACSAFQRRYVKPKNKLD